MLFEEFVDGFVRARLLFEGTLMASGDHSCAALAA